MISNYKEFIKDKCQNCQIKISESKIYYKCSICQTFLICQRCEHWNFHKEHVQLKIKPKDWETPLPFQLEIKQTTISERCNRFYPEQKCLLTPRQAAVYDQILKLQPNNGYPGPQNQNRFVKLIQWFRYSCPQYYFKLVD